MWSILGFTRSITKNESQLIASALRANYSKMFSGMIRKFSMLSLPFCVTIKVPVPSVADPGCLSRIPDLGSRIQKQQQMTGVKNFFCQTNFCSHKFHKTEYFYIFDKLNKKNWPNFPRIIEVFTQKIVTKPSKIWVWDPGSGKNLFRIPDPGSRGQKGTGSRIRNTARNTIRNAAGKTF